MGDKNNNKDYLKEDEPINGQNFVCLSFISPEGIKNTTVRALKIRGVFDTYEEAQEHAKRLQEKDPHFHIFVGEVGKWLPWDPNPDDKEKVKDSEYYEQELQKLIKGYEENRERARKEELARRNEMMNKGKDKVVDKDKVENINKNLDKLKEIYNNLKNNK